MHPQELSIELPLQGAPRATEEGSKHGWQKPQRFPHGRRLRSSSVCCVGKRSMRWRVSWGDLLPVSRLGVRRSSTRVRQC
jgi:hypothetical protein